MSRIALATCASYATLPDDDRLLLAPLRACGVHAEPAVWDDETVDWSAYDAVVVRSCWDYHLRPDAFARWIDRLDANGIALFNAPALLRWNTAKTYLRDLARAGIATVPTAWIDRDTHATLAAVLASHGWTDAVVKPVVSASAFRTWRVRASEAASREHELRAMLADGAVMVQPFVERVARDGEWSLVFIDGAFSHAVLKRPRSGDFRVQAEHGGSAERTTPSDHVLAQAGRIVREFARGSLYARVDGFVDDDALVLMELELVEPSLFLGLDDQAPNRFADAIVRAVRPSRILHAP